jgi:hypothetical protein
VPIDEKIGMGGFVELLAKLGAGRKFELKVKIRKPLAVR